MEGDFDTSGVMGWFTTYFPLNIVDLQDIGIDARIKLIKESYRESQQQGKSYLLNRYGEKLVVPELRLLSVDAPNLLFNFINANSTGVDSVDSAFWTATSAPIEVLRSPINHRSHSIELNVEASRTLIRFRFRYVASNIDQALIHKFSELVQLELQLIVDHCVGIESAVYTPSDFPDLDMDQNDLDDFLSSIELY